MNGWEECRVGWMDELMEKWTVDVLMKRLMSDIYTYIYNSNGDQTDKIK